MPDKAVFYAVLKANAYGHGLREIALTLAQAGCRHFAVESPQEGIRLRNQGITSEIILMNPVPLWMAEICVQHDLSVSVIHPSILLPLEEAARSMNKFCRIHLNVNVGLHRMGIARSRLLNVAREAADMPHLILQGIFGQPRTPESAPEAHRLLKESHRQLIKQGITLRSMHFANSAAFLSYPETAAEGARLGILLYGVLPIEIFKKASPPISLKPAMGLDTELVQIRDLPKGSRIGYHSHKKTKKNMKVGVIPLGYYHGLDRKLTHGGYVLLHERKVFFVGSISMNAAAIDITGIPGAKIGDRVTIIGKQGDQAISINQLAIQSETIAAELMMRLGGNLVRAYTLSEGAPSSGLHLDHGDTGASILYLRSAKSLPDWLNISDIIEFIRQQMGSYSESENTIGYAIGYALSAVRPGKGFILLCVSEQRIIGVSVCIQTETYGFIPKNILLYLCVHPEFRGKGLGKGLLQDTLAAAGGDLKAHIQPGNPAAGFFKKMGFEKKFMEYRYTKGKI
jgi:alanine racemase